MDIADLLSVDRIVLGLRVRDKAHLLLELGRRAEALGASVPSGVITDALRHREQLGSTGLGGGFALPHASIEGLPRTFGMLVRLAHPIAFDAIDGRPVDLAFLLLVPVAQTTGNVAALATVSRVFRGNDQVRKVRSAPDSGTAYGVLTEAPAP